MTIIEIEQQSYRCICELIQMPGNCACRYNCNCFLNAVYDIMICINSTSNGSQFY